VRLVKEGRVDAVKLEGGRQMVPQVKALVAAGVAVMGHIGLTPQSFAALGGYRVQGRTAEQAHELLAAARELQDAGCFGIVLEMVPAPVAELLTRQLSIPTIGIGAGVGTSGQVQVFHDLLGLYDGKVPKFSRQFGQMDSPMNAALEEYGRAVQARTFPAPRHSFGIAADELDAFKRRLVDEGSACAAPLVLDGHEKTHHVNAHANGHANGYLTPAAATRSAIRAAHGKQRTTAQGKSLSPQAVVSTLVGAQAVVGGGRTPPRVVSSIQEWRQIFTTASASRPLGLVPTMGALHAGHLSLVEASKAENAATAVSIFVNPRQFAPTDDLATYPRPWERDIEALTAAGVDFVFAPDVAEMYPPSQPKLTPFVDLTGVDGLSEGARRPGFFRGVSTVVTKLLNIVAPQSIYFGQKDGLQCIVVRRLIEDLNFDTSLVVGETVREPDGLAMSSRNVYLSPADRAVAPTVYRALCALEQLHKSGERDVDALREAAMAVLRSEPKLTTEYVSLSSCADGAEVTALPPDHAPSEPGTMAAVAVKLGSTRLIDNLLLK